MVCTLTDHRDNVEMFKAQDEAHPVGRLPGFRVKTLVSGRKQKDFVILSFSMCSKKTEHA